MKRICLVDDQQLAIDAITTILAETSFIDIVGTFSSAEDFMMEFAQLQPDLSVVDLDLPVLSGIDAIAFLKSAYPHAKFLVLTDYSDDDKLFNALRAGADGYLLKKDALENLSQAIISVFEDGAPMTPEIAKKVIGHFQKQRNNYPFNNLTAKEKIVLQLLVDGLLYKEIAGKLAVSIDAIKKHAQAIYEKLHVRTRSEAIRKYLTTD